MRLNKIDGLNIVPFIDIMLAQGKIAVDLPSASSTEQIKEDEKKVSVVIDKDNKFFIDDAEISEDELKDKLNAIDTKTLVQLKSDKNAKFESFVKVIDILKEKGHENFAIQTVSE